MPRYIDADALINKLESLMKRYAEQGRTEVAKDYNWACTVVDAAPTADVEKVVYCKECKRGKHYTNMFGHKGFTCELLCADIKPDDYCSYGERRNDA